MLQKDAIHMIRECLFIIGRTQYLAHFSNEPEYSDSTASLIITYQCSMIQTLLLDRHADGEFTSTDREHVLSKLNAIRGTDDLHEKKAIANKLWDESEHWLEWNKSITDEAS